MKPERWNAQAATRAFEIAGSVESVTPYGSGHINDTFLVVSADGSRRERNVLQRINHEVFRQPEQLMENVERVSAHLSRKLVEEGAPDADRRCLTLLAARTAGFSTGMPTGPSGVPTGTSTARGAGTSALRREPARPPPPSGVLRGS